MRVDPVGPIALSAVAAAGAPWLRRMRGVLVVCVGIGALSVGQVMAQDSEEQAAVAEVAPAKPAKQAKVCRVEDVTGSRMRKRICRTPEQWEARERAAQQLTRELDARSVGKDARGD